MRSFNPLASLFASVAASLSSAMRGGNRVRELPYDQLTTPKPRYGSDTPPKPKRAKRRRSIHTAAAERYRRFCGGENKWAQSNTGDHRHGAQRRRHAFARGEAYEARSRHVGNQMVDELQYTQLVDRAA